MGVGRVICVALPLILTVAALVTLLIATLSGVTSKDLYIFSIDLSGLTIDASSISSIASDVGLKARDDSSILSGNITASELGLGNEYLVTLWGYCTKGQSGGKETCTKAQFDWAASQLNTSFLTDFASFAGVDLQIPSDIQDALKDFRTGIKWTEVAYIAALVALGVELILGIFSACSRAVSCITWLESCVAAILACVAAAATTAMALLVTGAVDAEAKQYGIKSSVGTTYLAVTWLGAAFAIGSAATWIFTICCCAPNRHDRKGYKHRSTDGEKLLPSSYAPLDHSHEMTNGNNYYNNSNAAPQYARFETQHEEPQYANFEPESYDQYPSATAARYPSGTGRSDLAYEPYSHRA